MEFQGLDWSQSGRHGEWRRESEQIETETSDGWMAAP